MTITFEIPEDVASRICPGIDASRGALEAVALEGYRSRRLSEVQVIRMLGFKTRFDAQAFLARHDMFLSYDVTDLRDEMRTHDRLAQLPAGPHARSN